MRGRVESDPAGVDSIAGGQIIGYRITLIDEAQKGLIRADPLRIEERDLRGRQDGDALGPRIEPGVSWTVRGVVQIRQSAIPKMIERDIAQIGDTLRVTPSFIIEEEEEVVFLDRPAEASAKLIAGQLRPRNAFAGVQFNCPVVEKSVCRGQRGTIVFADVPVKIVAAAFGHHLNLTAAAATLG